MLPSHWETSYLVLIGCRARMRGVPQVYAGKIENIINNFHFTADIVAPITNLDMAGAAGRLVLGSRKNHQ
jgi:hypothetical protein